MKTSLPNIVKLTKKKFRLLPGAEERFNQVVQFTHAAVVYSDYRTPDGEIIRLNDFQEGSCYSNFNFGPFIYLDDILVQLRNSEFEKDDWIQIACRDTDKVVHIPEVLVECEKVDEKGQFDYVKKSNYRSETRLNEDFLDDLCYAGDLRIYFQRVNIEDGDFPVEISVVIPVKNRIRTIADAVESALSQKADFDYNVIVVDNGSTDGTRQWLETAKSKNRKLKLIKADGSLTIGACWNSAVQSKYAGRFVIQLDSDDTYADEDVLTKVVNKFHERNCGMVVGTYRLTDFDGNQLQRDPIMHLELEESYVGNVGLRSNGFGAPRAYYTPLVRDDDFPNVSYGEDYAQALTISTQYDAGRVMTSSLYNCRRWEDNSDHDQSLQLKLQRDYYKDWLRTVNRRWRKNLEYDYDSFCEEIEELFEWEGFPDLHEELDNIEERVISSKQCDIVILHSPGRLASTSANVDPEFIDKRECFLCDFERPKGQPSINMGEFEALVNPHPIFDSHLTIVHRNHQPQEFNLRLLYHMLEFDGQLNPDHRFTLWFNGPAAGASAPDHLHYQAGELALPEFKVYESTKLSPTLILQTGMLGMVPCFRLNYENYERQDLSIMDSLISGITHDSEGLYNIIVKDSMLYLFLRKAHRANTYPHPLISPGAVEMAGFIVAPNKEDFDKLTMNQVKGIYEQVCEPLSCYREILKRVGESDLF